MGNISVERHWDMFDNAVNKNELNSKKEMPSAHRDITKSGVLYQVICIHGSKHSEDRASRCIRSGYQASTEWPSRVFPMRKGLASVRPYA